MSRSLTIFINMSSLIFAWLFYIALFIFLPCAGLQKTKRRYLAYIFVITIASFIAIIFSSLKMYYDRPASFSFTNMLVNIGVATVFVIYIMFLIAHYKKQSPQISLPLLSVPLIFLAAYAFLSNENYAIITALLFVCWHPSLTPAKIINIIIFMSAMVFSFWSGLKTALVCILFCLPLLVLTIKTLIPRLGEEKDVL